MAWPPPIPPNTRADSTAQQTDHAADHNAAADALTAIVSEIRSTFDGKSRYRIVQMQSAGTTGDSTTVDISSYGFTARPWVGITVRTNMSATGAFAVAGLATSGNDADTIVFNTVDPRTAARKATNVDLLIIGPIADG